MPTKRRRHAITETPEVKAALDELRQEQGHDQVDLAELVLLGAREKVARVRSGETGDEVLDELIAAIRDHRDEFGDPAAADEVKRSHLQPPPLDRP